VAYTKAELINRLHVSEPILAEYEQALLYPRLKFSLQEVDRFMALVRRASVLVGPARLVSESTHDADNRFLECAEDHVLLRRGVA
jgi:predicted nucleic acid-binding protein